MSGPAILVVDDAEMNRDVLTQRLRALGYDNVATAENGAEALAIIEAQPLDLVLLDIMMPVMNGYQVLERLREAGRLAELPVVVVSALAELDSVVRCLQLGAEDYLTKPINAALLRARLAGCLEKKGMRDELKRQRERMEEDLRAARALQLGMLPADIPAPTAEQPVTIHARMEPARELGGDLCDVFFPGPRTLCFAVGDVSGKGAAAALFMARTHSALRSLAAGPGSPDRPTGAAARLAGPAEILAAVNQALCVDNHTLMFTTMILGVLDLGTGALRLAAAGHDPPYLLRRDGIERVTLPRRSPPLGVTDDAAFYEVALALLPGDALVAFTDGVTEAETAGSDQFGEGRLEALLEGVREADGGAIATAVQEAVATFRAGAEPTDDLTLLVLRWASGGTAAGG